ncbi:MAG: phosphatase PAP2 family protein [Halanaeroarchaeum sp.]
MRGIGVTVALTDLVPPVLVPVLEVVTGLGDPAFLAAVAVLVYWLGPRFDLLDRRDGARVLAVAFVAFGATLLLKNGFALPRPPATVALISEDGAGFPSGHATGASATYAALAVFLDRGRRSWRYGVAGALIAVVALSRVLLGVHYLVDVLAGVAVGLVVLLAVRALARSSLTWAFATAVPLALGGTLLHPTVDGWLQVGMLAGAAVGWWLARDAMPVERLPVVPLLAGLLGGGALVGVGYVSGDPIVAGVAGGGAGALLVAGPGLLD